MKKEKQNAPLLVRRVKNWLIGALVSVVLSLGGARIVAGIFADTVKYESKMSFAAWGLLFLAGLLAGMVSTLLSGRKSLADGPVAGLAVLILYFLLGLLTGNGLCTVTELVLRGVMILSGALLSSWILVFSVGRKTRRKRPARRRG